MRAKAADRSIWKKEEEMLAVFDKSVAKSPEGLKSPASETKMVKDECVVKSFCSLHPGSVIINLGLAGSMAYTSDKQNPLLPRY